jgi:hypothetical protein
MIMNVDHRHPSSQRQTSESVASLAATIVRRLRETHQTESRDYSCRELHTKLVGQNTSPALSSSVERRCRVLQCRRDCTNAEKILNRHRRSRYVCRRTTLKNEGPGIALSAHQFSIERTPAIRCLEQQVLLLRRRQKVGHTNQTLSRELANARAEERHQLQFVYSRMSVELAAGTPGLHREGVRGWRHVQPLSMILDQSASTCEQ